MPVSERYESIEDARRRQGEGATFTVLKVGARQHLEELAEGHLRFRRLSFYQAEENRDQPFHDQNEGLLVVAQASQTQMFIEFQGKETVIPGLTGQVVIRAVLDLPVMCLFSIDCGDWVDRLVGKEDLPHMLESMNVPPEMNKSGDTVWVIRNLEAFLLRVKAAARAQGLEMSGRRMTYIDLKRVHDQVKREDLGFVKDARFQHEREFRIRIEPSSPLPDPFVLDVGDLRDISTVMPLDKFRKSINLAMKPGDS
jgi:hypothetical protein